MTETIGLNVVVRAIDMLTAPMRKIGSAIGSAMGLNKLPAPAKLAADAVLAIGAAAVAVGVTSVKMAGDFQQAMLSNVAHAGLAKDQVNSVSQAILNMAPAVGRSPTQLAEAMYPILSAFSGITNQGAKSTLALSTLKMSFQAVAGTTVNGADVANAAVGTFNSLGMATNNAAVNAQRMAGLFDIMDKTVQDGNMQWSSYKNVISKLAVSIQGTSVKFTEASSALATLTNGGMSAQKAQTYLSNMFTTMIIKTDALAKHAKAVKVAFDEHAYSSMSLAQKISYLNTITDGNKQKLLALLGGNATALKSFNALSVGLGSYKSNLLDLQHAHGALQSSFATAAQGFNFSMSRAKAAIDVVMIRIGQALIPVVTQLVNAVIPVITRFSDWLVQSNVIGNTLSFLGNVLGKVGQVIGIVVGFISQVIQSIVNWNNQTHFLQNAIAFVQTAISDVIGVIQWLISAAITVYGWVGNIGSAFQAVGQTIGNVVSAIVTWFNQWKPVILSVGGAILLFFLPALIKSGVEAAKTGIQIATKFVQSMITTGQQAVVQGAITTKNFIASMIQTGRQAVVQGAITVKNFVASMIMTGRQAIIQGAITVKNFVASLITTGLEGWKSAGKLAVFIGQQIATGTQSLIAAAKMKAGFIWGLIETGAKSVWSAAQIAGKFIVSLVQAGTAAVVTAAKFVGSLIPSIVSFATTAITAAATAIPAILAGFASWAVGAFTVAAANIAAFWPVYLIVGVIIGVIALVVLAIKNWGAIATWLQGVWNGVKSFFVGLWNGIVGLFHAAVAKLGGAFNVLKIIAIVAFAPIALPIMGIIALIQHWGQIMGWIGGVFKAAIGGIGSMVSGALHWFTGLFQSAEDKARQARIQAEMHTLAMKDQAIKNSEQMAVKSVAAMTVEARGIERELEHAKTASERKRLEIKLAAIKHAIAERVAVVHEYQMQREAIAQHMKKLQQENEEAHKNIFQHAWDWVTRTVQGVMTKFGQMKDWVVGLLTGWVTNLQNIWKNITTGVQNGLGGLGKLVTGIWDSVKNAFKGAIDWIIGGINSFIGAINGFKLNIPAINVGPVHIGGGSIGLPKIPLIPLLASGGVITASGLAGIHDRGAEVVKLPTGAAVYPHGSVPAEGVGGGRVVIHNHYNNVTINAGHANARETLELVKKELARDLRRSAVLSSMASGGKAAP